jgi:hypothetical protein
LAAELQRSVDKSIEAVILLRQELDSGIEDYEVLKDSNNKHLVEHNVLQDQFTDLESELVKATVSAAIGAHKMPIYVPTYRVHV